MSKIVPGTDAGLPHRRLPLKRFSHLVQDYGTFFKGFDWQISGCGTYRNREAVSSIHQSFRRFLALLERRLKTPIAVIAALEHRESGCGRPQIRPHWHFLMACPPQLSRTLLTTVDLLWTPLHGDAHIEPYNPALAGSHYLAKTAKNDDFDYIIENTDRMSYRGPLDIFKDSMSNPNVPDHIRDRGALETLRVPRRRHGVPDVSENSELQDSQMI